MTVLTILRILPNDEFETSLYREGYRVFFVNGLSRLKEKHYISVDPLGCDFSESINAKMAWAVCDLDRRNIFD